MAGIGRLAVSGVLDSRKVDCASQELALPAVLVTLPHETTCSIGRAGELELELAQLSWYVATVRYREHVSGLMRISHLWKGV